MAGNILALVKARRMKIYLSTSVYCSSLAIYLSPHELTEPTCHIIGTGTDCFSPNYYTLHTVGVISNSNCSAV